MNPEWTPMRWPAGWQDPSLLALLSGTSVNYLLVETGGALNGVAAQAQRNGIRVGSPASPPSEVTVVPGEWPGLKMSRSGAKDVVSAGPTGAPWVDSNGWRVRLAMALHPGSAIWVDAAPKEPHLSRESYLLGVADAAAYGGRWIISLDDQLAAAVAAQTPAAFETWKKISNAADFFAAHRAWSGYVPEAVVGVVSNLSGENEFLSHELLNLLARTNEQYRIVLKTEVSAESLNGLKAVLYPDTDPPSPNVRKQILDFVQNGGMLIAGPKWGELPGEPAKYDDHPRYASRVLGKGRVAIGKSDLADPYLLANDSVVLISHRYDLLRFWNGGALGSYLTTAPDRTRSVVQMLFFAKELNGKVQTGGPTAASVRVAGRYRSAKLWTLNQPEPARVEIEPEKDAVELHLPALSEYAAVELEV